jgi:hypothetical protein
MRTPAHFIVAALVAGILAFSLGCNSPQVKKASQAEHYPYYGPLVETNGVPVNPPRW